MDLVPEDQREQIFLQRETELKQVSIPLKIQCFRTSIWDETLYKVSVSSPQAWSSIVYSLIPNVQLLESHLGKFCTICEADEVVLFERATFLVCQQAVLYCIVLEFVSFQVISHATSKDHKDVHRFEKISNIVKQFKLSCRYPILILTASKSQAQFMSMEVKNSSFSAFIDEFTSNTYIMVVMSDSTIRNPFFPNF
jgi:Ras-related GTP-binding protein A/B